MPVFNYPKKEVNVKVVYYGPGLSGKTTNLQKIHDGIKPDFRGKLVSLATQTDRTLFFDFMPMELGSLGGYKVRLHLYTVPGQVHYNATRKLVLKGVDGVVFVADSQKAMSDANMESVMNLEKNLQSYGKSLADLPHIIQANKRDLDDVISMEEIDSLLNHHGAVLTEAVASDGSGVMETLTGIVRLVMRGLKNQFDSGMQEVPPPVPAPEKAAVKSQEPDLDAGPASGTEAGQEENILDKSPPGTAGEAVHGGQGDDLSEEDPGEDLEREIAMNPALDEVEAPEPDPEPDPESGPEPSITGEIQEDLATDSSPDDDKRGTPVKILAPVEGVGTLELTIQITARVLKEGEIGVVEVGSPSVAPSGEVRETDLKDGVDIVEAAVEPSAAFAGDDTSPEEQTAASTETENYNQLDESEAGPLAEEKASPELPASGSDLPALGEDTDEPLGAPLDGQEPDTFDIPDLPREDDKIILDEAAQSDPEDVPAPEVASGYDPSVQPLDFDFPDTTAQDAEPKKKGLFGRFGKKK